MAIIKKFRITTFKKEINKISLQKISLSYNKRQILDDVSFNVREGEICGLLGPNGVGKSTIFNIIVGLVKPNYGNIFINQKNVTEIPIYKRSVDFGLSIVPQSGGIFSNLTCLENLKAISEIVLKNKSERNFRIEKMISKFELDAVKNTKAKHLSGGQRKKVSIAMSLISNPKIILMDEPFAGVDPIGINDIKNLIKHLTERNIGILITDHQSREVLDTCEYSYIMYSGQIIAEGDSNKIIGDQEARKFYLGEAYRA